MKPVSIAPRATGTEVPATPLAARPTEPAAMQARLQQVPAPSPRLSSQIRANQALPGKAVSSIAPTVTPTDNPTVSATAKSRSELVAKLEGLRQRTKTAFATVVQPESQASPADDQIDFAAELTGNPEVLADLPTADTSAGDTASNLDSNSTEGRPGPAAFHSECHQVSAHETLGV
jgi:hypothetical protein